ncbi:uncharacterized protein LOC143213903 [Lasioglossum baleicum]|uniref:uncharacterized protein LOC143213903 n=1 Tax=Lasioglossum baleicum TaxID=434251 RepID=UPI003FCC8FC2
MQIKFYYKMARNNNSSLVLCANTVQENERMLHGSCRRHQMDAKSKEDLEKLFIKLNSNCQLKVFKEDIQATSWSNKHVMNYTYGPIPEFPPSSWWGIRMDCSRDRVHDPFEKNAQIGPFGVTSFCTSSINSNEDIDLGDFLTLTGQRYFDEKSDADPLIKNYESQIPVRLIRSYNLFNEFAPKTGYRYDGLYIVANVWIGMDSDATKYYKFALLRLTNQDPPPWSIKQSTPTTVSLQNNCESSSSSLYEFKKYLHSSEQAQKGKHDRASGSLQSPNFVSKKFDEKERGASESAIVTRHVFKKGNGDCTFNAASTSVMSENKSLTHMTMQGSKAHNTNISIRTGLYDSSHNTQHDVKRNTLPSFCRTVQPLNLPRANPQAETVSLSSKDKNRSLDGKVQTIGANEFHERVDYISSSTVKSDTLKVKLTKDSSTAMCCSSTNVNLNSCYIRESNVGETYEDATNDSKEVQEINSSDALSDVLNLTNSFYGDDNATGIVALEESQELKSLDSLDTLTPDKILHLINNKCHPLSKLLMGNMIGLTSEQSVALKTRDLSIVQPESKSKIRTQKDVTEETKTKKNSSDDLPAPRYYKFRRHRRLSRKMMNGELQKRSVQSSNILEQSVMGFNACNGSNTPEVEEEDTLPSNGHSKHVKSKNAKQKKINCLQESSKSTKKNIGTRNEMRTRLRTVKAIKSSMKKHINKKQRREIANLLIDAKIGPKIRGPRNRRLRCINNTYSKHSCERFGGGICTLNKCQINPEISGQQTTFKTRGKLIKIGNCKRIRDKPAVGIKKSEALKENRIHKNLTVPGKLTKRDVDDKIVNNNNITVRGDNKKSKITKTSETSMVISRKRKLMQPISTKLKTAKSEEAADEVSKPCKTDAVTQCSLIKEPLMRNLKLYDFGQKCNRNEQYTFIKIEYGESKDVKSETCEAARSDNEKRRYKCVQPVCNTSTSNNILKIREQNKVSMKRVSAFVPVNALDSDLKIARLRSIGFKPIPNEGTKSDANQSKGGTSGTFSSKVLRQNVAEKYNKYTNEENDIVVYMDDELQYQDIEDEDNNLLCAKRKPLKTEGCGSSNDHKERESSDDPRVSLEQDLESPWHGWKKIVTNTNTYWVGW